MCEAQKETLCNWGRRKGLSEAVKCHDNTTNSNYDRGGNEKRSFHLLSISFHLILPTTLGIRYFDYSHFRDEKKEGTSEKVVE